MQSIAMVSLPAFLTISSFIASPTPCCPFLPLIPLQSPLKKTRYPDATISEVSSRLVSCSPITSRPLATQCLSRMLMWPMPLTPLTVSVRTFKVLNVSSSSRDLALAASCVMRVAFLIPRSPVAFSGRIPSVFRSVPGLYPSSCLGSSDVLGAALPARLDFSVVDTLDYWRGTSKYFYSPRFGSRVFRGGGVPTFLPQVRLPQKTISRCWDVMTRLCLQQR